MKQKKEKSMRRCILMVLFVVILSSRVGAEEATSDAAQKMIMRRFEISLGTIHRIEGTDVLDGPGAITVQEFLATEGVDWPEGASCIRFIHSGIIVITNTEDQIRKIETILAREKVERPQIVVEMQFVRYKLSDIDKIAHSKSVDLKTLRQLWGDGKGVLVASPRVVTQPGLEASVKGVNECMYFTELSVHPRVGGLPNETAKVSELAVVPAACDTREVGAILTVLPELDPVTEIITVTLFAELVESPEWREYSAEYTDSNGKRRSANIDLPFFHSVYSSTTIRLKDKETLMLAGGIPIKNESHVVYMFISARLIPVTARTETSADETSEE